VVIACDEGEADLDGWQRYPECVADQPDTPIATSAKVICCVLLGHDRPAKGSNGAAARLTRDAPGMMSALVGFWMHPDAVYLSRRRCITPRRRCGR